MKKNKFEHKTYCSWCAHFGSKEGEEICNARENKIDSYKKPDSVYENTPEWLNKENDCPYYEATASVSSASSSRSPSSYYNKKGSFLRRLIDKFIN